jgi:hypothetical protein
MWQKYFPRGKIVGLDVNDASHLNSERVQTYVVDQGSRNDLEQFVLTVRNILFDVIVDDGSHRPDHQQLTLGLLFPLLKVGGLYFIEDLTNNGRGDRATGRNVCNSVYNTRRVLREYSKTRRFPEPNGIVNANYLHSHIAEIAFHNPRFRLVRPRDPVTTTEPEHMAVRYQVGTEKLCAIRKA